MTAGKPQGLTVQSRVPETKKPTAVQGEKAGNNSVQRIVGHFIHGHSIFNVKYYKGSNAIMQ